ncbi:enoyl-CoA hydratase/isomerase family protein [Actinacidiphila bryophytorum]|uniref:Enoyl-CoA hydratase/isomerase family protein n=1 Tax=Actinacidiphila bryophytorum TaxID=1436133 RepID=A0A9W4E379_9ACTN|nr:enoyl-CoA hydratase/isomerase family protein [Actinacidiphila bryophytorum]MBM9440079.1 enoyl-CoA hydratase/isomerase family protein [Actinacidiphila bryophytorum]MBN6543945.1 enoyl-CoA hydratase/isomerase family protein [Actinacidiphila bryophytorum]CAG7603011.1 Enoyl-CoA hydratase/isomerase family protein [Actinacidiphila bryophytorum]
MTQSQFHVEEVSPSYWKVTFTNGDINLIDVDTVEQLADLVTRIEQAPELNVVVFRSSHPDFFMAHWDVLSDRARVAAMQPGPTGLHPYGDNLVRLGRVPPVTVTCVNGRARGAGSEFVLATDIRFAGPQAVLGQFEVGMGSVPGGNPMGRLTRLVGKARAMEILLGADDFPADLAAAYGYVNRVLPAGELDGFVDAFARRVAGFDRVAVTEAKALVVASLPIPDEEPAASLAAYFRTSGRPETADRMTRLLERGLQRADGAEVDLGRQVADPR